MFDYVKDKKFLGKLRGRCSDLVNMVVMSINSEKKMKTSFTLVGSGARNMITQNGKEPIDLDYNLVIEDFGDFDENDCQGIKEYVIKKFKEVIAKHKKIKDYKLHDSTSVITTDKMNFDESNQTKFSVDLAIIKESNEKWFRLIHEKTADTETHRWFWNEGPHSKGLDEKVKKIKSRAQLWNEVRKSYIDKKNYYLKKGDNDHPSCVCYIETVNEVYNKHFGQK